MITEQFNHGYLADYRALAPNLPGQDLPWLQQRREQALQQFSGHGFPHNREEEWRYTNLAALNKTLFKPAAAAQVDAAWLAEYYLADAHKLVLINGQMVAELSDLGGLPDEVIVSNLRQTLNERPDAVQAAMGQAVTDTEHSLIAFNSAWFGDGVFVQIPFGVRLNKPLQILHVVTEPDALAATRNLFVLEDRAEAEVVETFIGSAASYFTAAVNEVILGEHAGLTLYKQQCEAEKALHFGGTYVKQAQSSRFQHHNFAFGGVLARSDIHSDLDVASECSLNGLYLANNRQHIDNHTRINHLKPQGVSREYYKGVLDQRGRGVFQGRVVVAEDAQQTDSEMNNRNLLLSADAEVDTKPQLEIYADDVKCSHGVTVGQLEDKSVFYLQSRGMDEASARNILTFAFANDMVDKVENAELKELLLKELLLRFPAISL